MREDTYTWNCTKLPIRIHGAGIYANMNVVYSWYMLPYVAAPWILWVTWNIGILVEFSWITSDGGNHQVRAERPPQKGCANPSEDPGNPTATVLAMETADELYAKWNMDYNKQ